MCQGGSALGEFPFKPPIVSMTKFSMASDILATLSFHPPSCIYSLFTTVQLPLRWCYIWPNPGSFPCRKAGREPGQSDHVPCDVPCVVLCVVLVIELLPTQSILSVIRVLVHCSCWNSGSVDVAETTDGHWKAVSLLAKYSGSSHIRTSFIRMLGLLNELVM